MPKGKHKQMLPVKCRGKEEESACGGSLRLLASDLRHTKSSERMCKEYFRNSMLSMTVFSSA